MTDENREPEAMVASLRESEARFRDLFDRAPVGYYECDAEGMITRVNQTALTLLGHPAENLMGHPEWAFVVEWETAQLAITDRLAGDEPTDTIERTWLRRDGSLMPALMQYQTLRDSGGGITGLRATIQDITAYKQMEEQLRYTQKMQTIGQLAGGMAHEFNNLLQVITGYSEILLSRTGLDETVTRPVGEIKKSADQAVLLIRQLLAFGQKLVSTRKVLDLSDIVTRMNGMFRSTIGEDIELITVTRPGLWRVKADPGQIEQVLLNLAVNARDAMPQGGRLTIETSNADLPEDGPNRYGTAAPGPYVMVSVSDSGCGMDEDTLAHLFEPFFTTKGAGRGIGLGLATLYGIVVGAGGALDVRSEPGQGATFRVYLPRTDEPPDLARTETHPAEPARRDETILIVEDEDSVRTLIGVMLRGCGHTVLEARHGLEALRIEERHRGRIHLLVTDLLMPHMDGHELVDRLRTLRPDLKVICMSAQPLGVSGFENTLPPRAVFLRKPFRKNEFIQQVREVLDSE